MQERNFLKSEIDGKPEALITRVIVIEGDAASGKTRLLWEIMDAAGGRGAWMNVTNMPYGAVRRYLDDCLSHGFSVICADDCGEETLRNLLRFAKGEGRNAGLSIFASKGPNITKGEYL